MTIKCKAKFHDQIDTYFIRKQNTSSWCIHSKLNRFIQNSRECEQWETGNSLYLCGVYTDLAFSSPSITNHKHWL